LKANTISIVHSTNAFLPLLKNGSVKKVLMLSSGFGDLDLTLRGEVPAQPSYSIVKAALNMVVAKYAAQYKTEGFVFLSISPGFVDTSATQTGPPSAGALEERKMLMKAIPLIAPNFTGPISTEQSVQMQLEVFENWPVEKSGAFVSHYGNTTQWL
ncbi:hypothetical protein R3P38DRAFT_2492452, partial [Favolaschia claudopus]